MNREKFYTALRRKNTGVFGTRLSQRQVEGMENLLDVWENDFNGPIDQLAYNLATAYHETAHTMQPIMERGRRSYFDKYEPGTRLGRVLGNTQPGDGYKFRGAGHVQNTGRRNARYASKRLGLIGYDVDFVANPEKRLDPKLSAVSLFLGNQEGWWTSKGLPAFLDGKDESDDEDFNEYVRARATVNGKDRAVQIARYAVAFEQALIEAGYQKGKPVPKPTPTPTPKPAPTPEPQPKSGLLGLILSILSKLFKR